MTNNPELPPGINSLPAYVDSSMLTTFKSCRRKFYWNYIRNLRSPGKSVHLVAGGAFAKACDEARKYWFTTENPSWDLMLEAAFRGFIHEWGPEYQAPEGAAKSMVNVWSAFEAYMLEHPPATDPVQPFRHPDGTPTVEFSFSIPLPISHPVTGDPIIYVGRFDMLGKWGDVGTIMDEKTTSALGTSWLNQWDLRGQFLGYCWACQQLGYPVRQAVIRGVGILKTEIKFLTALQQYPQYLIDRWYEEMLKTVNELVISYQQDYWTYNFGDACSSYAGCSYKELCVSHDPEEWVANYDVEVWNPIRSDGSTD